MMFRSKEMCQSSHCISGQSGHLEIFAENVDDGSVKMWHELNTLLKNFVSSLPNELCNLVCCQTFGTQDRPNWDI